MQHVLDFGHCHWHSDTFSAVLDIEMLPFILKVKSMWTLLNKGKRYVCLSINSMGLFQNKAQKEPNHLYISGGEKNSALRISNYAWPPQSAEL